MTEKSHDDFEWVMVDLLQVHVIHKLVIMGVNVPPPETDTATDSASEGDPTCWPNNISVIARSSWGEKEKIVEIDLKNRTVGRDINNPFNVELKPPVIGRLIKIEIRNYTGSRYESYPVSECLRWNLYGCPIGTPSTSKYCRPNSSTFLSSQIQCLNDVGKIL